MCTHITTPASLEAFEAWLMHPPGMQQRAGMERVL